MYYWRLKSPARNSINKKKLKQGAGDALLKEPADLVGREISAVVFARDWRRIPFRRSRFCAAAPIPEWLSAKRSIAFPSPVRATRFAWSSAPLSSSLSLDEARHLEFTTSNGCRVRLPLGAGGVLHFRADRLLQVG